jgi:hypothetical protein
VSFDFVAEVVQRRKTAGNRWMYGGATIVLDAMGHIRYAIVKNVLSKERERRSEKYLRDKRGYATYFTDSAPACVGRFKQLHSRRAGRRARPAEPSRE